ncbi:MAG TPA: DsbC family protein [Steroidobacteraceae bacterium]|jgi:thiol:disulfide interchange protein DsbC|nr:DsbC family protein [Steroidobacteraceae bacterium]
MSLRSRALMLMATLLAAPLMSVATPTTTPTPTPAASPTTSAPAMTAADPRVAIAAKMQGVKAEDLHATPIPGIYELLRGGDAAYVSTDGKYAIIGDLYETGSNKDLTENRRRDLRLKMLAEIPEAQMVVFGPLNAKHTITVFTDMDCAYCRKLHSQISDYNRLGIKVRYIAYPRSGPNTSSWTKAEQVWCAADRNSALTEAKLGKTLPNKICPDNPVAKEYELGQQFNLQGTPTLILGNGEMVGGYLPPQELADQLKGIDR